MPKCPSCGNRITFRAAFLGRLDKKGCTECGVKIMSTTGSRMIIGAVCGGNGALIASYLRRRDYSLNSIIISIIWFALLIIGSHFLARYELKEC